jgi:hypothetical protein
MNWAERLDEVLMSQEELEQFLGRMAAAPISPEDYRRIETLCQVAATLGKDNLSKLKQLLFGRKTEATDKVCGAAQSEPESLPPPCRPKKGHGRNPACRYTGARWIPVPHPTLRNGDRCPKCQKGRVRQQRTAAVVMRIVGSPPVSATAWSLEKLRCDTCGQVFTAPTPPEAGDVKYDPSVGVTVALLRYGTGMPHYRLARLQQSLGVPLPESTQWELMLPLAQLGLLVLAELIRLAAQSPLFYNDDTSMRVLDLRRTNDPTASPIDPKRKGTFTTGIIAQVGPYQVALFTPARFENVSQCQP